MASHLSSSAEAPRDSAEAVPVTLEELSQLQIFQGESRDMLEGVLDICETLHVEEGRELLQPGQNNPFLYLLVRGQARVQLGRQDSWPLALLGPGECFGEMSIIGNTSASAWVIALTDCRLIRISAVHVWELINRSAIVPRNLLYLMCSRIRHDNNIICETVRKTKQYERESRVDMLTGLRNRRWLDEMLPRYMQRFVFTRKPLTVLLLDVDFFKQYNDRHGHLAGDRVLAEVGRCVMDNIRPSDAAVRYGGEEFLVILPETDMQNALVVAERLCIAIASREIVDADGASPLPGVTASLGVAASQDGEDGTGLLKRADAELYRAKQEGRNRICY